MASPLKLTNNAIGRLTAGMSAVDTTAILVSGNGALFPTLGVGEFFPATIIRASDLAREIVKVTARSTDVLTVARAQEGTSALIFIAGDRVELRLTGGTLSTEFARVEAVADAAQVAADAAQVDADAGVAAAAAAQVDADAAAAAAAAAQATANAALPKAGGTMTGDLVFSGTARRITGDFTTGTQFNRLMFQTSTANADTAVGAVPNGTGTSATFVAYSESDPTNAAGVAMAVSAGEARLSALALGTEPQPVLAFYVNGAKRAEISTAGVLQFNSGYGSVAPAYGCRAWAHFRGKPLTGTYSRTGTTVTVSITAHTLSTGMYAALDFTSGAATDGTYLATVVDANTFTVTDVASGSTSGNVTMQIGIRSSGNVSSITDDGTGQYTLNFTTPMPDDAYAAIGFGSTNSGGGAVNGLVSWEILASNVAMQRTASALPIATANASLNFTDALSISVAVFR